MFIQHYRKKKEFCLPRFQFLRGSARQRRSATANISGGPKENKKANTLFSLEKWGLVYGNVTYGYSIRKLRLLVCY